MRITRSLSQARSVFFSFNALVFTSRRVAKIHEFIEQSEMCFGIKTCIDPVHNIIQFFQFVRGRNHKKKIIFSSEASVLGTRIREVFFHANERPVFKVLLYEFSLTLRIPVYIIRRIRCCTAFQYDIRYIEKVYSC